VKAKLKKASKILGVTISRLEGSLSEKSMLTMALEQVEDFCRAGMQERPSKWTAMVWSYLSVSFEPLQWH